MEEREVDGFGEVGEGIWARFRLTWVRQDSLGLGRWYSRKPFCKVSSQGPPHSVLHQVEKCSLACFDELALVGSILYVPGCPVPSLS